MSIKKTMVLPGLWFKTTGPIGQMISGMDGVILLNLCGIPDFQVRVQTVLDHLSNHPDIVRLIGHSGACPVIIAVLERLPQGRLQDVILLNPAPLAGTRFKPCDPMFWITLKYTWRLLRNKELSLEREDVAKLFSITEKKHLDDMMQNLCPENAEYLRFLVFQQWRKKHKTAINSGTQIHFVSSSCDSMLGSTRTTTINDLRQSGSKELMFVVGGHMWSMQNLHEVIKRVDSALSKRTPN